MGRNASSNAVKVSILALPETTPGTFYGLYEVLSSAGLAWSAVTGAGSARALFDVDILSLDGRPLKAAMGVGITPNASIGKAHDPDIILVSDLELPSNFKPKCAWPGVTGWLKMQYDRGAIICSVCTGAVLLADAGLLDDRQATTHWGACHLFQRFYPAVDLQPQRIVVPAGDGHRIITGGGASAWQDMALYLIARFWGETEAIRAAKIFLFGDRSEGQLPYAVMGRLRQHKDAVVADCQAWAAEHYSDSNPVARMTERSGLAERTFKRRFRAATGYTPMDYVQTLRIEEAKQILETTNMATDLVAQSLGYEDPTFFRRLFKKRTGVTPGRYRQRFKSIVPAHAPTPAS